jgi:hypothetical protein
MVTSLVMTQEVVEVTLVAVLEGTVEEVEDPATRRVHLPL